jgi:hypothetical protein
MTATGRRADAFIEAERSVQDAQTNSAVGAAGHDDVDGRLLCRSALRRRASRWLWAAASTALWLCWIRASPRPRLVRWVLGSSAPRLGLGARQLAAPATPSRRMGAGILAVSSRRISPSARPLAIVTWRRAATPAIAPAHRRTRAGRRFPGAAVCARPVRRRAPQARRRA